MALRWGFAVGAVLLVACSGTPNRGRPGRYARDSLTTKCRQQPELCSELAREGAAARAARTVETVASAARTGVGAIRVLEAATQALIEKDLAACADDARSQVLIDHMDGKPPTPAQCNEEVHDEASDRRISRAMLLGCLMHEVALACTRKALGERIPGRFSLEQRYRYDRESGTLTVMSAQEVRSLLRLRCGDELKGTLVPDIVIHSGDPIEVLAVYDFKFPCVNSDTPPRWREYELGHPYQRKTQAALYQEAFGVTPHRVTPRIGVTE